MSKSSNIVRWVVFGVFALITVALAVWYYLGLSGIMVPAEATEAEIIDSRVGTVLGWSYINVALGLLLIVISAIIVCAIALVKGVQAFKAISLGLAFGAVAIFGILAFVLSPGWIDGLLNWFYLIFGFSLIVVIASVIITLVKKA